MNILKKFLALILLVSLFVIGCTSNDQKSIDVVNTGDIQQDSQVINDKIQDTNTDSSQSSEIKEFTIHGSSFKLVPVEIKVKKGEKVRINYISDDVGHNLVIDDFGVKTNIITKGQTEVVEFIADKEGKFSIYCSVGSHRSFGMEGNLIVEL